MTPKRKTSKRRRDQRSANKAIKPAAITSCLTCQSPLATHSACRDCGYYKGVKVLTTKLDRMHKRGEVLQAKQGKTKESVPAEQ